MNQDESTSSSAPSDAGQTAAPATDFQELTRRCQEYLEGWKRAQADYQNLQKQVEREREAFTLYAREQLLRDFLPVMDALSRALNLAPSLDELPEERRAGWANWLVGVRAVYSLWESLAAKIGLEPVQTNGYFDPAFHEAVGQEEIPDQEVGMVARVLEQGWQWHGRVVRPARVIVSTSKKI